MGKDAPPPYTEHLTRTSTNPPAYAIPPPEINPATLLPQTFRVGPYDVAPFVTVPEMKAHLKLLAGFDALQTLVRETPEATGHVLDGDTRWSVFCTRAEKNFERWVKALPNGKRRLEDVELPPLDVVMCWHAYMLNPRRYYEDCERDDRVGKLARLGAFPKEQVVSHSSFPCFLYMTDIPTDKFHRSRYIRLQPSTKGEIPRGTRRPSLPHRPGNDDIPAHLPSMLDLERRTVAQGTEHATRILPESVPTALPRMWARHHA